MPLPESLPPKSTNLSPLDKLKKELEGPTADPRLKKPVEQSKTEEQILATQNRDKELRDVARAQMKEADRFIRWMGKPEYRVLPGHKEKVDELLIAMQSTLGMAKEVLWKERGGEMKTEVAEYSVFQDKIEQLEYSLGDAEFRTSMEIAMKPEVLDGRPMESLLVDPMVLESNPDYVVRRMFTEHPEWPQEFLPYVELDQISTGEDGQVVLGLKQHEDAPLYVETIDGKEEFIPSVGVVSVSPGREPSYELYQDVLDGMTAALLSREADARAQVAGAE